MASRKTVTPDNLAALGAERLAAILTELAEGNAEVKRRLRLELAAQSGGDTIAAEIGKRITTLKSARSFIDWQKRRDFVKDLDLQRTMITDRLAQSRADLALDLMWRFTDLAEPVLNRVDDSNGRECNRHAGHLAATVSDGAWLAPRPNQLMRAHCARNAAEDSFIK